MKINTEFDSSTSAARVAAYKRATELLLQCVMEGEVRDITIIASHPALGMKIVTTLTTVEALGVSKITSVALTQVAANPERFGRGDRTITEAIDSLLREQ